MMSDELQVVDLVLGEGKAVVKGALIRAHYRGTLIDGTEFDSSWSRGQPFECVIGTGRVIKGWDLGLMGMKVGGKRTLIIPSELAYGSRAAPGGGIPPNSALIFDVELIDVK